MYHTDHIVDNVAFKQVRTKVQHMVLLLACIVVFCNATPHDFYPSDTNFATDLRDLDLGPGDVVNFHAATPGGSATYDWADYAGTFVWHGDADHPIIIQPFPGDTIIFTQTDNTKNILDISGSYFVFRGFEMTGSDSALGSIALRLRIPSDHIVIEDLYIHDIAQTAITANHPGAYTNLTFRGNTITRTGGEGECLYLGCQGTIKHGTVLRAQ